MIQIEVTDEVKEMLDSYVNGHNEIAEKYPNSVQAYLGRVTHSDIIMWLYKEVFSSRQQSISDKDFGRTG